MHAQPEWLRQVPTDKRLPEEAVVVHTGCGTSFHAAQTGGFEDYIAERNAESIDGLPAL